MTAASSTPDKLPDVCASVAAVRQLFRDSVALFETDLPNPHHEPQVDVATRATARAASVLMLVVDEPRPVLMLTRRASNIRFGGHQVFPGGLRDPTDRSPLDTALRETEEEVGLARGRVEVLGRMPDYFTHSGYCVAPFVAVTSPPVSLTLSAAEVAGVSYLPLDVLFDSGQYLLQVRSRQPYRANYYVEHGDTRITGPTISLIMSLHAALAQHQSR